MASSSSSSSILRYLCFCCVTDPGNDGDESHDLRLGLLLNAENGFTYPNGSTTSSSPSLDPSPQTNSLWSTLYSLFVGPSGDVHRSSDRNNQQRPGRSSFFRLRRTWRFSNRRRFSEDILAPISRGEAYGEKVGIVGINGTNCINVINGAGVGSSSGANSGDRLDTTYRDKLEFPLSEKGKLNTNAIESGRSSAKPTLEEALNNVLTEARNSFIDYNKVYGSFNNEREWQPIISHNNAELDNAVREKNFIFLLSSADLNVVKLDPNHQKSFLMQELLNEMNEALSEFRIVYDKPFFVTSI